MHKSFILSSFFLFPLSKKYFCNFCTQAFWWKIEKDDFRCAVENSDAPNFWNDIWNLLLCGGWELLEREKSLERIINVSQVTQIPSSTRVAVNLQKSNEVLWMGLPANWWKCLVNSLIEVEIRSVGSKKNYSVVISSWLFLFCERLWVLWTLL